MGARRVYRVRVPVDDRWHAFALTGPILSAAARHESAVDVWYLHEEDGEPDHVRLRAYGTGHVLPEVDDLAYLGTCVTPSGRLVWHLVGTRRDV